MKNLARWIAVFGISLVLLALVPVVLIGYWAEVCGDWLRDQGYALMGAAKGDQT